MVATAALVVRARRKQVSPEEKERRRSERGQRTRFQWLADLLCQKQVKKAYDNPYVQWAIAGLIMGNFISNIIEKSIDPWNFHHPDTWLLLEKIWNIIFIVELIWNIYGSWYLSTLKNHFICSGWNIFDCIVVGVSIPSLLGVDLGSFSQLRMLRAFRVFRLFKRIKSLNKIITSLGRAVPGIVNAATIQLLVMCIYAILAVDLFGAFGVDGVYKNINTDNVTLVTTRAMDFGEEYYGNFHRSLFTLFQVLTGESWSEAVARPILFADGMSPLGASWPVVGAFFYVSYIIICGIVLVNVAVAVLLEKMTMADEAPAAPSAESIVLQELPEHVGSILAPLDLDADGQLTRSELERAAELLKGDQQHGGNAVKPAAGGGGLSAELLSESVRTCIRDEMERTQKDLQLLRDEAAAREARLLEALTQAAQRESVLRDSLQALSTSMETLSAHASRPRRKGAMLNGKASNGSREDRVQDGERDVSKQAPDRVQRL